MTADFPPAECPVGGHATQALQETTQAIPQVAVTGTPQAAVTAPARVPGAIPVLGHSWPLLRDPMGFLLRIRALGDVAEIRLGRQQVLVVNDPALIRKIMVVDAKKFDKGSIFEKAATFLGNGLVTSSGEFHLRQRRLVQPAFHHGRFPMYMNVMNEVAHAKAASWQPYQTVDLPHELHEMTFRTVAGTLVTSSLGASVIEELNEKFAILLNQLAWRTFSPLPFLERLPIPVNRRFNAASARIREVIYEIIAAYRADGVDREDFMSLLLFSCHKDTGRPMPDEDVCNEAINLMIAGTETNASMLGWTFYHLSEHPEAEKRLREEIAGVIGGGPEARPIVAEDLASLSYSRRVLNEVMRLHPLALVPRRAVTEVEVGGRQYPAGTQFFISPHAMHHDSRYFPEPAAFDPDRWLPDRMAHVRRETYIPFGAGVHQCLGDTFAIANMSIVLAAITASWSLQLTPGCQVKEKLQGTTRPSKLSMTVLPNNKLPV